MSLRLQLVHAVRSQSLCTRLDKSEISDKAGALKLHSHFCFGMARTLAPPAAQALL